MKNTNHFTKSISICVFLVCLLIGFNSSAQPAIQWQKSLGGTSDDNKDIGQRYLQTSDGGYIVMGFSSSSDGDVTSNHGDKDYWVVKSDATGNITWQKSLGGSGAEWGYGIQQTTDGGYIVAGTSASNDDDVTNNHGGFDYWVVKLDSIGNITWQKTFGGSGEDWAYSVQETTDGGYVVAGYSYSNDGDVSGNHGASDYWVVKLDAIGNIIWQKTLGGSGLDGATSIQQTDDSGYIVLGGSRSNDDDVSGNHGEVDYWVVKLDATGNVTWQKSLGGGGDDYGYSVQQTADGGYTVAGFTGSTDGDVTGNHGGLDDWIVKLDDSGNITWQKSFGGSDDDVAYSILQITNGDYLISGYSASIDGDVTGNHGSHDYWILKTDGSGNLKWQESLGGSGGPLEAAFSFQQTSDGGYIVAGLSNSNDGDVRGNHGGYDYWVVKLLCDGPPPATISAGGPITVCKPATVILKASAFGDGVTYQWKKGSANIAGATNSTYTANKTAKYKCVVTNSCGSATSNSISVTINAQPTATITPLGNLDICQTGSVVLQANSGAGYTYQWIKGSNNISGATNQTYTATKAATYKVVVTNSSHCGKTSKGTKVTKSCREESITALDGQLTIFPNPCDGKFSVQFSSHEIQDAPATIQLLSIVGKLVFEENTRITDGKIQQEISLSSEFPGGIYFLEVRVNDEVYREKVMLQK